MRELMFGPRRFGELRNGLPGISANVLTQRLEGMEAAGILIRRRLPPPASVQVYELTALGYAAETAIKELGRWAARSPLHDPTLPLSPASIMLSFRTMLIQSAHKAWMGSSASVSGTRLLWSISAPTAVASAAASLKAARCGFNQPDVAVFGRLRWTAGFGRRGERRIDAHRGSRAVRPLRRMGFHCLRRSPEEGQHI